MGGPFVEDVGVRGSCENLQGCSGKAGQNFKKSVATGTRRSNSWGQKPYLQKNLLDLNILRLKCFTIFQLDIVFSLYTRFTKSLKILHSDHGLQIANLFQRCESLGLTAGGFHESN